MGCWVRCGNSNAMRTSPRSVAEPSPTTPDESASGTMLLPRREVASPMKIRNWRSRRALGATRVIVLSGSQLPQADSTEGNGGSPVTVAVVTPSRFKRAHKTHAFNQSAGMPYPNRAAEGLGPSAMRSGDVSLNLFAELCERVPDAATRASLLGVAMTLDEAWLRGERLPVLRAHRKRLKRALQASRSLGATDSSA